MDGDGRELWDKLREAVIRLAQGLVPLLAVWLKPTKAEDKRESLQPNVTCPDVDR